MMYCLTRKGMSASTYGLEDYPSNSCLSLLVTFLSSPKIRVGFLKEEML